MINEAYTESTDETLVKASLKGDRKAFEAIVSRHRKMVARTVKGMLGDSAFAEDIGQDVFIKLYGSLSDFRGDAKLSTYIQKIAVNMTLNELKRRKRFTYKTESELHEYDIAGDDAESRYDAKATVDRVLKMLEPKFRTVVVMRMLQGYSVKETAAILELPAGTVLSRLSRAQEQLRKYLKNNE
ncbi:MAG: RNA polymerase sigma factor [Bacteroidales bacterium]|jgi:RNA polymerase sigma-70 factor (ECF subfamily)|nr:RNA polymerase sigma factor [Bacteroidales bacterium]